MKQTKSQVWFPENIDSSWVFQTEGERDALLSNYLELKDENESLKKQIDGLETIKANEEALKEQMKVDF